MRLVLDTNVIVAGLRSPAGASAELLERALDWAFVLALEYEAVATDPAQRIVSGLAEDEVRTVISVLCAVSSPVETHFLWRPRLHDPANEMVLEAAINGQADAIVTFNRRAFGGAPAEFGLDVWAPRDALRRIGA
jgi:predicted nucleic acid-binding protein